MKNQKELERKLKYLGLLDKTNEIYSQLGDKPVIRKKKILIVEDEFGLKDLFINVFLMEGYDVRAAEDDVEGIRVYCQFEPDLFFTDVVMPRINGLELVRKINCEYTKEEACNIKKGVFNIYCYILTITKTIRLFTVYMDESCPYSVPNGF